MSILTETEKAKVRQLMQRKANELNKPISWIKDNLNAAAQAVENRLSSSKSIISSDIETAAPGVFDASDKKRIAATVFQLNYIKDII